MADVLDLGSFKLQRKGNARFATPDQCAHVNLQMEDLGQVVRCLDCKAQVSAWWALNRLAENWQMLDRRMKERESVLSEAMSTNIHLVAARRVQEAWRSRKTAPSCPHCHRGILPEDQLGSSRISRDMELRRRQTEHARTLAASPPADPAHAIETS